MDDAHQYWYSAKRFGRRTALTWQGWVIDLGLITFCLAAVPWFRSPEHIFLKLSVYFGALFLRATVAHWKGEPQEWQ